MAFGRVGRLFILSAFLFFQSGCAVWQKTTQGPLPAANWKTVNGQVRYADEKRTFVADVTIREGKNSREYSLEVTKGGASLLLLARAENLGWATGLLARRSFSGPVSKAPVRLQNWFRETTAALENARPDTNSGIQYRLQR